MESATSLDLPPGFSAIVLREYRDAFEHAKEVAADEGAGTLVWVRRLDTVEFAVVLEPEEPLGQARRAIYAGMNAAADALAAHCPPEKPITFEWPDTILLDHGIIGGAILGWPEHTAETEVPVWLVLGVVLRAVVPLVAQRGSGGHALDVRVDKGTSLEIEGFEMIDGAALIASFARHLMIYVDLWQAEGFSPVGRHFLDRLTAERGVRRTLDGNGDLLVRKLAANEQVERRELLATLSKPQWLDPETGDPWL